MGKVALVDQNHLQIEIPATTDPVVLYDGMVYLAGAWTPPQTRPCAPVSGCWAHRTRDERPSVLAGCRGRLVADTFTALGMELRREVWTAHAGDAVALRQRLRNRGTEPILLDALVPFRCADAESLLIAGVGADTWEVVAQRRLKNGVPTSFRPGVFDGDYTLATGHLAESGDAAAAADAASHTEQIEIDPFCLLHLRDNEPSIVLLAGYLSQQGHCARLLLQLKSENGRTRLDHLTAECEFDGCVLPVRCERTSQWLLLMVGQDANGLVADYANRVGRYHGVQEPPKPAPTVMCTWYHYGPTFTEADLNEDLGYLVQDRIPFDVFLIDECWDMSWGDWEGGPEWPSGMQAAADRIRALGYRPGIWTCPALAKVGSQLAREHPEWLLHLRDGTPHVFTMGGPNYVLDPTYPGVCQHIEELFRRMTFEWGFTYHKLDFMRALFIDVRVQFYNPAVTRLEAYRMALHAVRRGAGPDAYISVCGGHYGGSLGLADSQRSGSDVVACWDRPPALPKFKQNVLRTWMNRLWHVDPDAMMVRRRQEPINDTPHGKLSIGRFTDEEARTIAINQYVGGGMVCLSEKFLDLDADRKALYRHVIPSVSAASIPLSPFEPVCPSQLLTHVTPQCADLDPWVTLAVVNWTDATREMSVTLTDTVVAGNGTFLVFGFFAQKVLGLFCARDTVELGILPPHSSRLLRIAAWNALSPVLAGTDLHFSGGGVEVTAWNARATEVEGRIETGWDYSVRVTVAFPEKSGFVVGSTTVKPGEHRFHIGKP